MGQFGHERSQMRWKQTKFLHASSSDLIIQFWLCVVAILTHQTCTTFHVHMWTRFKHSLLALQAVSLVPTNAWIIQFSMCDQCAETPALAIHCILSTKIRRMTTRAPKKRKLENLQKFSLCVIMCRISWRCVLGGPCSVRCGAAPSGPDLRGVQGTA